jgi:hypothetical protein
MSRSDLDALNRRARAARDQPGKEVPDVAQLPEPEPVAGEQMELLL